MSKRNFVILIVVLGLLFVSFYPETFVVHGAGGGVVFWNSREALLFMGISIDGADMTPARYAAEPVAVALGHAYQSDDQACLRSEAIRITDKDVQTYNTELSRQLGIRHCIYTYPFFGGNIYAVEWPKMLKWAGSQFELPTPKEYAAYVNGPPNRKVSTESFSDVDGWSMRRVGSGGDAHLILNGQQVTIVFHGATWPPAPLSVELVRPGQSPQTIWRFDGEPRLVKKVEYQKLFRKN